MLLRMMILAVLCCTAVAASAETRVALVIGNGAYANVGALDNPPRDAAAVAKALRDVGFQTVQVEQDLGHDAMLAALRRFETAVDGADWALVYYAGHGIEVGGVNYLVPTDARMASDRDVDEEAVSLPQVQKRLEGARKLRVVILDACRDDPFLARMKRTQSASRSVGQGLAVPDLPQTGSLVAYSAAAGQVAMDGETAAGNSPYATALVRVLAMPDLEVNLFFRKVRTEVLRATDNRQEPATYESLPDDRYVFRALGQSPSSSVAAAVLAPPAVPAEDGQAARVAACDRLTAQTFDLDRPPSVSPARYSTLAADDAVAKCRTALERESDRITQRRLHFELGRAFEAQEKMAEAISEYRISNDAGSAVAAASLARLYAQGNGVGQDMGTAVAFTRISADRGSASSMAMLGSFYMGGQGVPKDVAQGRALYEKAAALGDGAAMVGLGGLYLRGDGVAKDAAAGNVWLDKGAATNDPRALLLLGLFHLRGEGGAVPVDYAKARALLERAAAGDNPYAMTRLGDIYSKGIGVARDVDQATAWYEKALHAGDTRARQKIYDLTHGG